MLNISLSIVTISSMLIMAITTKSFNWSPFTKISVIISGG
jgi:hypothetical protein